MQEKCPQCSSDVFQIERYCPTCSCDIGAPNVRICGKPSEIEALKARYTDAMTRAELRGVSKEWGELLGMLRSRSGVVVAVPATVAKTFVSSESVIYANYETLVGNARRPARPEDDKQRRAVSALVFGTNASDIRYGNLAIEIEALPSYGDVAFRLRNEAIERRVTFMECNSFVFASQHSLSPSKALPKGFQSLWNGREHLALAKLGDSIAEGQTEADWKRMLVNAHPTDRAKDDFVEAHIFGSFNVNAVQSVTAIPKPNQSKQDKIEVRLTIQLFNKRGGTR